MSLFKSKVELIVIRDPSSPQQSMEYYSGRNLEDLVKQAFKDGISNSVRFYHADLTKEVFGLDERKDKQSIKAFCGLKGRVYAQVVPMGLDPVSWIIIGVSVAVSLAATFLLAPKMPDASSQSQPSPNNALANRTNSQRLGGRVPDIFGEVWSVPDLIAPTYNTYIDGKQVEYSYMCVGRGKFNVKQALDDTTPIAQVFGSSVLVYDPDTNLKDSPVFVFGSQFNPDEAEFAALAVKRYTAVNGQLLPPKNDYLDANDVIFRPPNIIELKNNEDAARFTAGSSVLVEGADNLQSGNNLRQQYTQPPTYDENGEEIAGAVIQGDPILYTLDGQYEVESVTDNKLMLVNPAQIVIDWQRLTDNADFTKPKNIVLSTNEKGSWQGWFYTNARDHSKAMINIRYPKGLFTAYYKGGYKPLGVAVDIETEVVDAAGIPVNGTSEVTTHVVYGSKFNAYWESVGGQVVDGDPVGAPGSPTDGYSIYMDYVRDDELTESGGKTILLQNSHWTDGKYLRFRVRRSGNTFGDDKHRPTTELRLEEFYSYRNLEAADMPKGVTTVYTKTLATEGALSIKERKLRLLVERYVTDFETKELKLSKRADDIIYHIATDPKIGNLTDEQIDFEQIKNEIDILVSYFGSEKFAEFCYTFDDNNLSSEEIIQTVARAVFSNAKRYGNKLMLDFEREVPASVAVFNSHNILPDSYAASESFGVINEYDGAKVEYADPVDDAQVTKSYPSDAVTNPHTEKLIGVRNELQATAHMMRLYNKDRFTYKSCEITAGDESNIVTRTNRITVASQTAVDVRQGSVEGVEVIGSDIVLHTSDPVNVSDGSYLFIQTINNGVESIACSPRDDYSVTLARLPQGEISTDWHNAVRAVYQIVGSNDGDKDAYIVTKKDPSEGMTNKLTCTNYSSKFYQNDKDYSNT